MDDFFSEYDDFLEWDEEDLAEWEEFEKKLNAPSVHLINQKRYAEFQYSLNKIGAIICRENPDAKITYTFNDESSTGTAAIRIKTDELAVYDVKEFIEAVKFATSIRVGSLPDCNLIIDVKFGGVLQKVDIENMEGKDD